jgi:protein involved in polysaccharide export with SLBB domain
MTSESAAVWLPTFPARARRALDLLGLLLFAWLAPLCLGSLCLGSLCLGCGPRVDNSRVKLPTPVESTTLGPGDLFTLEVVGEKDLPKEFQVASDGTVDFPYVHRIEVQGLEPQEIARTVRERLIEKRILTDPSVIVSVKEYNSKRVTVLGEVRKPGSFPLRTGMTLVQAISDAGGLSAIANGDRVNLTRKDKGAGTTVVISFDSITSGKSPDIPLQAGDQIFVNERVF